MKVILTEKPVEITAKKDGRKWVILNGLSEVGANVNVIMSAEQAEQFGVRSLPVFDAKAFKEFFAEQEMVECDFDQRGRLVAVSA